MDEVANVTAEVTPTATAPEAAQTPVTLTPVQTDIQTIEVQIAALEAAGKDLFADEITSLKAKAEALMVMAVAEAKEIEAEAITIEQTFFQKYGQAAAHVVEIVLLAYIAGRLAGVL